MNGTRTCSWRAGPGPRSRTARSTPPGGCAAGSACTQRRQPGPLNWYRADNESFLVLRVVWAVLITALIGLIAWRGAAFGSRRGVFALPGLAVGLGLGLGDRLDAFDFDPVTVPTAIAEMVLLGTAVLVTVWAGYCATLVRIRWHSWFLVLSTAVVTFTLLGWFPEARVATATWRDHLGPALVLLRGPNQSVVDVVVVPFLLNSNRVLTVASLALIWLVPLVLRREFPKAALATGAAGGVLVTSWSRCSTRGRTR